MGFQLLPRRRDVPVVSDTDVEGVAGRDELTLTTYNVWNDSKHAQQRHLAIAQLLSDRAPDVMVFQEVTPEALEVFLAQQWIRNGYRRASAVGGDAGDYGMLLLSRLPVSRVTYTRLPSRQSRGFLQAELTVEGTPLVVCCIHLDSGKSSARLRAWQLRRIFGAMKTSEDVVVLGDFNMRDAENSRIAPPCIDVWPTLRPDEDGFTEDTSINLMRYDMNDKHRHVRFDRVLLKSRRWRAADIELLGKEPIAADLPRVFPSDHFGVECRLTSRNP
jgi:tyrosyl-DNA phosphodiesterase 2